MNAYASRFARLASPVVGLAALLLQGGAARPGPVYAQAGGSARDTVVSAGSQYEAGGLHRILFGRHYRDLWTARLAVGILDMQSFGGGLTPTTAGGGFQTKSLRFRGNDGFQYGFRSVDKDPSILPPELEGTFVEQLVRDQTSSAHPAGPALAAPLMAAAGILHTNPRLVVLPDVADLGEFRERFAGTLGFIEERAITEHAVPFAGAAEIIDGDEIFERVQQSSRDRVDARALLAARLVDLLIGDWDRHRGQWGWARFGDEPVTRWVPIPEDRDQAFVRYDGLILSLGRITTPQIVNFGNAYPSIFGLTWNGRELDRRFLMELEKPVWDSVATSLQTRISDSVIDAAVSAMPTEYRVIDGSRMAHALKRRRDDLKQTADRFYRLLAREVAVHATDEGEVATVDRGSDGSVDLTLARRTATSDAAPYFRRRFDSRETSEIRVYLHGGDDSVVVRGDADAMTLRFIGGDGSDLVINSSRGGGVRLYTADGDRAGGATPVKVDRREFVLPPKRTPTELPPRDWGQMWRAVTWASLSPDVGFFIGGGAYRVRYGFRHLPFASRVLMRAGYSTGGQTGRFSLAAQFHRANSRLRVELDARASGIEILRFHGFGNEVQLLGPNDNEFYRVNHTQYSLDNTLVMSLGSRAELSVGPTLKYSSTADRSGRFLATIPDLYGSGNFGQLGLRAHLEVDTRDIPAAATRGVHLTAGSSLYPALWDVVSTFGEVHAEAATYLSATRAPLRPTLALRAGAKKVWGTLPFQEAAYIGDAATVRLGRQNRYAGDASVYGNAELRLRLSRIFLLLPGHIGVFGLGDIGRVFLERESSDRWHNAVGGGVWLSFLDPASTLSVAVARSEVGTEIDQRTGVYIQAGFAF
jgi:hypothetical protein